MSKKNKLFIFIIMSVIIVSAFVWYVGIKQDLKPTKVLVSNINEKILKYDVSTIHPVLDWSHRVMGGTIEGKWFNKVPH